MTEDNEKVLLHKEICEKLTDIYRRKNKDYGDSYAKVRKKYPNSVFIRSEDKISRLETLLKPGTVTEVADESIDDTLLDLANYWIMEAIERRVDKNHMTEIDELKRRLEEAYKIINEFESKESEKKDSETAGVMSLEEFERRKGQTAKNETLEDALRHFNAKGDFSVFSKQINDTDGDTQAKFQK